MNKIMATLIVSLIIIPIGTCSSEESSLVEQFKQSSVTMKMCNGVTYGSLVNHIIHHPVISNSEYKGKTGIITATGHPRFASPDLIVRFVYIYNTGETGMLVSNNGGHSFGREPDTELAIIMMAACPAILAGRE